MAIKTSTGLAAQLMVDNCCKDIFDGGVIKVFSGAATDTADAAETGDTLWTISVDGDGTGITFESTAVGRAMVKTTTETWQGATEAGTAGYWRLLTDSDGGDLSTTDARIQGTCGTTAEADMYMASTTLTDDTDLDAKILAAFSVALPTY